MSITTGVRAGVERDLRTLDGHEVSIQITSDKDYAARVDVAHDGRRWVYGVTSSETATLVDEFEGRHRVDEPSEPEWMRDVFVRLGVDWQ